MEQGNTMGTTEAGTTATGAAGGVVAGVDVSKWQGAVDFGKVKAAGMTYVFVKATEGITGVDPDYARNVAAARAAGLVVGSYHFYETNDDPSAQFGNFRQHADVKPGDLPPVVDIEVLASNSRPDLAGDLKSFLAQMEQAWGVRPILYSGVSFANEHLAGFGDYPLWVAEYTSAPVPKVPTGWTTWTFWQYSQSGTVAGVPGEVDMDRFNGTQAEFDALRIA
jgi:lysozyme